MKIVLLSTGHPVWDTYPGGGGIQHQILGMATEMTKHGHEVHIIARLIEEPPPTDGRVVFHPLSVRLGDETLSVLMFSVKAANEISSLEPDIVSAFERFSAYFPSHQSCPMTFAAENYDAFRYYRRFAVDNHPLNAIIHPWKCYLEEGVMKRARQVIALTRSTGEYLTSVGIHHHQVIPNGVSTRDYKNLGDGKYVLYAGRLDAPKRVDLLIRAFSNLRKSHDEYTLRIVGKGPQKDSLLRLASDYGVTKQVEFEDWASEKRLISLLGNCSVFVLPSAYETFGIALLQAMACSKPVIGSNTPGPRDIVNNWENGLLFENGSAQDLSRILATCLEDAELRISLGRHARQTVSELYDFSSVAEKTLRVYSLIQDS